MKKHVQLLNCLLFASLLVFLSSKADAQVLEPSYGQPATSFQVANGKLRVRAKINGTATACAIGGDLTVVLPAGYVYAGSPQKVTYTAGIASAPVALTATNITSSGAVIATGSLPASPDSVVISYEVYAGCGVIGGSGGSVSHSLSTPSCSGGTSTSSTLGLNASNAVLNITSVSNNTVTGTVGYTFDRVITIQNGGIGTIDTIYLTNQSGNGITVTNVTASSGTVTRTHSVVGSDTAYRYRIVGATADGHFSQNETITITETVKIVSCNDLNSQFTAWYGVNAQPCTATQGTAIAGASINAALQPSLTYVPTPTNVTPCMGGSSMQTLRFVNTGTAPLNSLRLNLFSHSWANTSFIPAANIYGQSAFNINSITYRIGANGTSATLAIDSSRHFTSPAPSLAAVHLKGNIFFSIPREVLQGDTVFVTVEQFINAHANDCNDAIKFLPGISFNTSYKNSCGLETQSNLGQNAVASKYMSKGSALQDVPSDMWVGGTYNIKYEQINAFFSGAFPDSSEFIFKFTFPSQSAFSGSLSDYEAIRGNGTLIPAPSSFVFNSSTNELEVRYKLGRPDINASTFTKFTAKINNITTDCNRPRLENSFEMAIGYQVAGCAMPYMGTCFSLPVVVHCPIPCPRGGITPVATEVKRVNYGLPDNNNDGVPDASGTLDFSKIATKTIMHGDSLQIKYSGKVFYGVQSLANFTTGHLEVGLNGSLGSSISAGLTPYRATVSIYNASGVLIGTQNNLPFTKSSNDTALVNYSIAYLSSFPSTYTRYNHGDSIVLTTYYRFVQPLTSSGILSVSEYSSVNKMYVGNTMTPNMPESEKYYCDYTGANFRIPLLTLAQNGAQATANKGCDTITFVGDNHLGVGSEYSAGELFSHEYRPISVFSSLKFKKPTGYTFVSASASLQYSNGEVSSGIINGPLPTPTVVGDTLVFNVSSLFTPFGGSWQVPDEGQVITYNIRMVPTCSTPTGSSFFNFTKAQAPAPGSGLTSLPFTTANYAMASGNNNTYTRPNVVAASASPNVTTTTDTTSWEVQVSNSVSNVAANNVWLAKKTGTGTVTITSVQLLSGAGGTVVSSVPSVNGMYQLGNFAGPSNKFYKINATYLNCVVDSLVLFSGYSCSGYPTSVTAADCKNELRLSVQPYSAGMQVVIISQPTTAPLQLCSDLPYDLKFINPNLGSAINPEVHITLPSTGGVAYKAGTFKIKVGTNTIFTAVADASLQIASSSSSIVFRIPASALAKLVSLDSFRVQFTLNTTACDFVSGGSLRFQGRAINPCGSQVAGTTQTSNNLRLQGASTINNLYVLRSTAGVLAVTSAYATAPYRFSMKNEGGVGPTPSGEQITVEIPAPLQLDLGSLVNVRNHTAMPINTTVAANGNYLYTWNVTPGVAVGDSIVFTANLMVGGGNLAALQCGALLPISESVNNFFTSTCALPPYTVCNSKNEIVRHEGTVVTVDRPQYDIENFLIAAGTPADHVVGSFTLQHLNTVYANQNVVINFYKDVNNNGLQDIGDSLIGSTNFAVANTVTQSFNFNVPSIFEGHANPILAVASFQYSCDTAMARANNSVVLPVNFTSFVAQKQGEMAKLVWITASEHNSKGFEVESSVDGIRWRSLGFVSSSATNGTSLDKLQYNYLQELPSAGLNFYRLKHISTDGGSSYSLVRTLSFGGENGIEIYPNPTTSLLFVKADGIIQYLSMYNIIGQKIDVEVVTKSSSERQINVALLPDGIYSLQLKVGGKLSSHRVTIKH